ncbi:hypothetical protein P7C71_g2519, partial [Lecanoromycetidae sp. Uapishka_2]
MLKSTYKASAELPVLPVGWTAHKAPSGHTYYYNSSTTESTYTRPAQPLQPSLPGLQTPLDASAPTNEQVTGGYGINGSPHNFGPIGNYPFGQNGHFGGRGEGRKGYSKHERPQPKDRPRKSNPIPGCAPWQLVQTKLGRRFVYNSDSEESFWKFPPDVMKGVVEYDRLEREKRLKKERGEAGDSEDPDQAAAEKEQVTTENGIPTASRAPVPTPTAEDTAPRLLDSDGEEYEEVEVTDDEDEASPSKRQKTEDRDIEQPVEFNEDDIAYQLAAMGEDYGLIPGEYGDEEDQELEEGAQGLALTQEDSNALFKDLLADYQISPYTPWEKVIEAGQIIEDDRYTVLPNMRSRREVWDEWSRNRIQQLREQRENEEKKDPKIPYFAFLEKCATPKLYWPEFRRKYKKEPEMHNTKLNDKDREKWYRDYIAHLKLPEPSLKGDLVKLLKSTPLHALNRSTTIVNLPPNLLTDIRYISIRKSVRDPLIEAHISTLPPAPANPDVPPEEEEIRSKEKHERERRQRALEDRQKQVEEQKRRQQGALRFSKGMLREGEEEVRQAMNIGKDGLLGHIAQEK